MASIDNFKVFQDYLPYQRHTPLKTVTYNEKPYQLYEVEINSTLPETFRESIKNASEPNSEPKKIKAIFINPTYCKAKIMEQMTSDALLPDWEKVKTDRDIILIAIRTGVYQWGKIDPIFTKHPCFILEAVSKEARAILYAHEELRHDRGFILAAIARNRHVFQYAPESLKQDKNFALASIAQSAQIFQYMPEDLKQDTDFILTAISRNEHTLAYVSENFKHDAFFIVAALMANGRALKYAPELIKKNEFCVLQAVAQCGGALMYAHEDLKKNKDVVLEAVKKDSYALTYAYEDLKKDKDFVLTAMTLNGQALEYVHESLKGDREVVLAAVKQTWAALRHTHESLRQDKEIILAAVPQEVKALFYAHEGLKKDREFALELIEINFNAFFYLSEELKMDPVLLDARNRGMLNHLRSLKENPSQRQKLIAFTSRIIEYQDNLLLHEEHPLFQEILTAHSVAIANDHPKNPYRLYASLQSTLEEEVLLDDFAHFRTRAAHLKRVTFADIPKSFISPLTIFDSMEIRGIDEAQVANLCNGASFEAIKENVLGEGKLIASILSQRGQDDEPLSLTAMYLYSILERLAQENDTRQDGNLSNREAMLLKFASMIRECRTGQADAIEQYYIYTINHAASSSGQAKIEESVDLAIQMALKKVLSNEVFLREIIGEREIKQQSHQTLYLQNRYHKQIGLVHTLKFDANTGVLYDNLIEAGPLFVIETIKHHLHLHEEVASVLDRALKGPQGISYMEFVTYFEEIMDLKDKYEQCFKFDEAFNVMGLTPLAINKILKHLGYVA
jgi:hypothetical protein